jgi:fatty-acyl-CoA synthase
MDRGPALTLGQMVDRAAARFPDREAVYPAEIEDFFLRHPKVLDVSIVGVPDPIMGEAVMAFVIPKDGERLQPEDIVAFARGRIANFKVPKYVEIVDRFPLTGSGKVQKFKQKAYAVEKYHLAGPA